MPRTQDQLMRALYDEHAPALWRYALRLTGDRQRAEDIVQEALLRAWQHPDAVSDPSRPARAWLYTVTRHLVVDQTRSARARHEVDAADPPERLSPDRADEALDSWLIAEALTKLTDDHRAVVVGSYYRGPSTAQLAEALQIAEGTVKSRLHYGLRALRLALREMGVVS